MGSEKRNQHHMYNRHQWERTGDDGLVTSSTSEPCTTWVGVRLEKENNDRAKNMNNAL